MREQDRREQDRDHRETELRSNPPGLAEEIRMRVAKHVRSDVDLVEQRAADAAGDEGEQRRQARAFHVS